MIHMMILILSLHMSDMCDNSATGLKSSVVAQPNWWLLTGNVSYITVVFHKGKALKSCITALKEVLSQRTISGTCVLNPAANQSAILFKGKLTFRIPPLFNKHRTSQYKF